MLNDKHTQRVKWGLKFLSNYVKCEITSHTLRETETDSTSKRQGNERAVQAGVAAAAAW